MPMPSSTPARTGRPRAHASMPAAVRAMAMRSQLVNACTMSSGDRHMIAVSQTRRRAIAAVEATAQRYSAPSKIAPIVKYAATSSGTGTMPVASAKRR